MKPKTKRIRRPTGRKRFTVSISLSNAGREMLDRICLRLDRSRGKVVEMLLRGEMD